jgi:hypothetical protein
MKLDDAMHFMRAIVEHCVEGGSFRHLIYDRMGLDESAYVPLYSVGGMEFSNACPLNLAKEVAPSIVWAGVGQVVALHDRDIAVQFETGEPAIYERWPGHRFQLTDPVLCIYLSTSTSGMKYALEVGTNYSVFELAEGRDGAL